MILEIGCKYVNFAGELIDIVGRETLLESVYYDINGLAYHEDGTALNGEQKFMIVSAVH